MCITGEYVKATCSQNEKQSAMIGHFYTMVITRQIMFRLLVKKVHQFLSFPL